MNSELPSESGIESLERILPPRTCSTDCCTKACFRGARFNGRGYLLRFRRQSVVKLQARVPIYAVSGPFGCPFTQYAPGREVWIDGKQYTQEPYILRYGVRRTLRGRSESSITNAAFVTTLGLSTGIKVRKVKHLTVLRVAADKLSVNRGTGFVLLVAHPVGLQEVFLPTSNQPGAMRPVRNLKLLEIVTVSGRSSNQRVKSQHLKKCCW